MPGSFHIRNIPINPGLVLSPMSGVTCSAFRRLIKELNPGAVGLVISEFISVEGLTRQSDRSMAMMRFHPDERPYGIQIFGYDIERMRDAAIMAQDAGADLIDINCGCPAPKVVKKGGGCELMRQPEHLAQMFREVRKAVSIPLTMKMRSGWDEASRNALEIAKIAESEGLEGIAVHGRTRAQLYRGEADWSVVEAVAESVKVPVSGSGDVVDAASAQARKQGKVAGLFIGRAALWNPFVFSEICGGKRYDLRHERDLVLTVLERYLALLREEFHDRVVVGRFKQLVSQMCRGHEWRKDLCRAMKLQDQIDILKRARDSAPDAVRSQSESPTSLQAGAA
ncbi:MAG: tRNA-dihydrouridine synthase [Deltaproteobacteria bacterium]|nr:tRNA-dihydrouridine synthase [Deltaproteobacteria bacterium]